jgi:hypothetical protein
MLAAGFCFVAVVTLAAGDGGLEVAVAQGLLRGTTKTTRGGRSFGAFEGIPFAQPPLGELRFKAPVPVQSWQGVKDATKPHNICPQRDIYRRSTVIEGNEDCLYLNVYTPQLNNTASRFPVMIFFHGGGWLCGGGNSLWYGPDILLDRDVILVVTNYRLGPLGFLSTGDAACPGNNGMKDQNLAMRWVKDNVAAFGGDPEKITIFGESAGGASAQLHMMSPLSKGRTFESDANDRSIESSRCRSVPKRDFAERYRSRSLGPLAERPSDPTREDVGGGGGVQHQVERGAGRVFAEGAGVRSRRPRQHLHEVGHRSDDPVQTGHRTGSRGCVPRRTPY